MTAIELYKFIQENNVEWRWENNEGKRDIMIFIYTFEVDEFYTLLKGSSILSDGGIECRFMDGYFTFWMDDICAHFAIELEEVFEKEKQTV